MSIDPIPDFGQGAAPDPALRAMFPNSPSMFEATPESPPDPTAARLQRDVELESAHPRWDMPTGEGNGSSDSHIVRRR